MMQNTPGLSREIEAARLLKATLKDVRDDNDVDLLADMIEGETSLFEAIDNALMDMAGSQALMLGIDDVLDVLKKRRERLKNRVVLTKAAILNAMHVAEQRKMQRPLATLSVRAVPPSLVIVNEANIPAEFWKKQDPTIDRMALTEALKNGATVPGASMSNGSETLSVRPL